MHEKLMLAQEELVRMYTSVTLLKDSTEALQASVDHHESLSAELKERKMQHSQLKAQAKDLKHQRRQSFAKESALKELLDL